MMVGQKKKNEHVRSILLQINLSKPREKRFLDKIEERRQEGFSYKEIFLQCFDTIEFKHVSVNTTSTQHVKPVHEKQPKKIQKIKDIVVEKELTRIEVVIKHLKEIGTASISKNENIKELQLELLKLGYVTVSSFKAHENCLKLKDTMTQEVWK